MPRVSRKKSDSGIYHIILRGINRQSIFEEEEDRERLLQTLSDYKEKCGYNIYAYCFMSNHLHLLLKVGKEPLEQIMRRICGSYVYWYNSKYGRIGNLFQDRFKSEPVESDSYLLTVMRYIHQNPVKAGIEMDVSKYVWSSFHEYIKGIGITDRDFILKMFHDDQVAALDVFIGFNFVLNDDQFMEIEANQRKLSDDELRSIIGRKLKIKANMIQSEPREKMIQILKEAMKIDGISTRQLARVTGVSANIIWRM